MELRRNTVPTGTPAVAASPPAPSPVPAADDDSMSMVQFNREAPLDAMEQTAAALPPPAPAASAASTGVSREQIDNAGRGDRGPGVSSLQEQLNALNVQPPLKTDGEFGPRTEAALKQFQLAHNLAVTGVVDDDTRAAIDHGMTTGLSALPERAEPARGGLSTGQPRLKNSVAGMPVIDQTKLPRLQLGESKTATLSGQGCVLASLAMVASKLKGEVQDPVALNDTLREYGAFVDGTGMLNVGNAALVLGLEAHHVDIHQPGALSGLEQALRNGAPVMVRVDYKDGPAGDHTIVLTHKNPDGSYGGVDPAGGRAVTMRPDAHGNLVGAGWRHYAATALTFVSKPDDFGLG